MKKERLESRKSKNGLTFIELLVALVVTSILAALAIPNYLSLRPAMRLNGAARMLMGDLMGARMSAVQENNKYKTFFLDTHRYMILDDDDGDGSADPGESNSTKDIQTQYEDVTFSSTNNPIFLPRGTATNLATITLQNSSGSKIISINIAGRVKLQ